MKRFGAIEALAWTMAAVGFFAAWLVESVDVFFLAPVALAAAASVPLRNFGRGVLPGRLRTILAVAIIVYFAVDYLHFTDDLLGAAARSLTLLLVLKLYDLKTPRDHLTIYAVVFFQMLAAAASTVSPLFFLLLLLFVVTAIFAMTVFGIKKDSEAAGAKELPEGLFGARFFAALAVVSAASIAVTFALFMILPRVGAGFFQKKSADTTSVSGFSDVVELGSMGPVLLDDAIVMRVEFADKKPYKGSALYMKGAVLDAFNGTAWSRGEKRPTRVARSGDGVYRLPASTRRNGAVLEQKVLLEPLDTPVIFAASDPVAVSGMMPFIEIGQGGGLGVGSPPYSRVQYTAWSSTEPGSVAYRYDKPGEIQLDASGAGDGPPRERVERLAAELTAGRAGALEKARAIEERLKAGYRYSLDPKKGEGLNAVDDFLFYSKEGYCEHYATAMALLLRLSGVPSRVVTGFAVGEFNPYGGYYIVRKRDAHSWVEAYVDGVGWTRFDPTPAVALPGIGATSWLSLYADNLRYAWTRHIVNYSLADQIAASRGLESAASGLLGGFRKKMRELTTFSGLRRPTTTVMAAVALAAIAAFIVLLVLRKRGSAHGRLPGFYVEMTRALAKKGLVRGASETPMEFAARTGYPEAVVATRAFEAVRYGGIALAESAEEEARAAVDAIKSRARGGKRDAAA